MSDFETRIKKIKNKIQEVIPVFSVLFIFLFFTFAFSSIFFDTAKSANAPSIINYQGKLLNSGAAVDATTTMQFLIYDDPSAGTLLYTAGGTIGAPSTISVPVSNGIFSVNMGAAGTNDVTSSIFADNSELYLEVWIGAQVLTPRKRLTATPYAMNSAYLMGYSAATVSSSTYIPLSDANGNFNFAGSITATGTATSSFTNVLVNDGITLGGEKRTTWPAGGGSGDVSSSTNNTFSGINTFSSTTVFTGKIGEPELLATYNSSTAIGGASGVALQGNYAFVTGFLTDTLTVLDIASSTNPLYLSSITFGSRPTAIAIQGSYAYVVSMFDDSLYIVDISNPKNLVQVGVLTDGGNMGSPRSVSVAGNYAYVAASGVDKLVSVDVSNPYAPFIAGSISHVGGGPLLDKPWSVVVSGKYAYVASETSDSLTIIDVSDPKNLQYVSSISDGAGVSPYLDGAHSLAISGKYAYVGNTVGVNQGIQILDISDPENIVGVGSLETLGAAYSLVVADNYLYGYISANIVVIDISDPSNPTSFASVSVGTGNDLIGQYGLAIQANKLYISEYTVHNFRVYDITGAKISNVETGNAGISNLEVRNNAQFDNQVSIRGSLTVGSSGLLVNGNFSLSAPTSSFSATNTISFSHTALFETSVSSTDDHAFIFNTKNSLAISTTTYLFSLRNNGVSTFSISSNGNVNTTGTYYGKDAVIGTPGAPGDLAERVDIAIDDEVEAGDVVVVDPHSTDTYRRSNSAYSDEVSGVISSNPTIVIGNGRTEHTAVMAMVGRVPIKVSDENGAIVRGDLLITATSTGYAMKYDPTKDNGGHVAGIVGVALESFASGKGKIMGLVRTGWVNGQYQQTFSEIRSELSRLALSQSNLQGASGVTVIQNSDGTIHPIESDLNLNGFSIVAVRSIVGLNNKWHIDENGHFTTTVDTSDGAKTLYALQSGESQYMFSGTATLENGKVRVDFDQTILDIIDTSKPLSINLTLAGKAKGIYVSNRDETGFDVEEVDAGTSNVNFDWLVFATRKNESETVSDASTVTTTPSESDSDSDHDVSDAPSDSSTTATVDDTSPTPAEETPPASPEEPVVEDPVVEVAPVPEPAAT